MVTNKYDPLQLQAFRKAGTKLRITIKQMQQSTPPRPASSIRTRAVKAMSVSFNHLNLTRTIEAPGQGEGDSFSKHEQLLSQEKQQVSSVSRFVQGIAHHSTRLENTLARKMCSTHPPTTRLSYALRSQEYDTQYFGDFVPVNELQQLTRLAEVEKELRACERPSWQWRSFHSSNFANTSEERRKILEEARKICGQQLDVEESAAPTKGLPQREYTKIFAVLALIGKPHRIRSFFDTISDDELPIRFPKSWEVPTEKLPRPFNEWRSQTVRKFEKQQWTVLSPIFHRCEQDKIPHGIFDPDTILPFTSWTAKVGYSYSHVAKASIHSHHHNLTDDNEVCTQRLHAWLDAIRRDNFQFGPIALR